LTPSSGNAWFGPRAIFPFACLMMAFGIGMAALAAHAGAGAELATAATLLLANAPMLAAAGLALALGLMRPNLGRLGAGLAFVGTILFAADMTRRGFGHGALFVDAAPIGGTLDMVGWLVVAIASLSGKR